MKNKGCNERKRNRHVTQEPESVELVAQHSFYHQGHPSWRSAHDVARDLHALGYNLSVQAVLACQHKAFDDGLISIEYTVPHERSEVIRLEQAFQERFGVRALLVPGRPQMLDPLTLGELKSINKELMPALARRAADYVGRVLAAAAKESHAGEEFRIGVAWGRTMRALAKAMGTRPPGPRPAKIKVFPIVGIVQAAQTIPVQANMIASEMAGALVASSDQLPCPAIMTREEEGFVNHHQVQAALAAIDDLRLVLTGLGPIEGAQDAGDIMLSPDRRENADLFASARAAGACGEICCWWFNRDGDEVQTPYRSVGLGIPGLQRIAADGRGLGRQVVIVAGGDKRRILPLQAAIKGGYASVVVTDTVTARALLHELPWEGHRGEPSRAAQLASA